MSNPSFRPSCPNHGEPLEGCGFPLPSKGVGKCPVSGFDFEFEVDTQNAVIGINKFGGVRKDVGWKVEGND